MWGHYIKMQHSRTFLVNDLHFFKSMKLKCYLKLNIAYVKTVFCNIIDIDECLKRPCDQNCTNTDGGYKCSCNSGFKLFSQSKCEDIDECGAPTPPCDQLCSNLEGSYKCSCRDGYLLNTTTRTCYGIKESTSLLIVVFKYYFL